MSTRRRSRSLPSQAEISPHKKYSDVTEEPYFIWSVRKVSVNRRKFWTAAERLGQILSPAVVVLKGSLDMKKKLPENIGMNGTVETPVKKNLPASKASFSCKRCESVIFVEEIITVDDPDDSDMKPTGRKTEKSKKMTPKKKWAATSEYRDYLRLKLKYDGQIWSNGRKNQ